jgi:hypothetical protein
MVADSFILFGLKEITRPAETDEAEHPDMHLPF